MLTLYFSGTGNTEYVARLFSRKMGAECYSIEDNVDFNKKMNENKEVAFCYPIYGSRVPLIMREFAVRHAEALRNKKIVIIVTQAFFSGDGARVFTDMFPKGYFEVIYAEHIGMPNNICNVRFMRKANSKRTAKYVKKADKSLERIVMDIKLGVVRKRGFSWFSKFFGGFQGKAWQGGSGKAYAVEKTMEYKAKNGVRIDADCDACGLCVSACPTKNLGVVDGKVKHNNNCTICYRCVNLCQKQAITTFMHGKPKWQYRGVGLDG